MANKAFKTKFGLSVGDEQATISGVSGNIFTNGNLQVNGSTTLGNDYITDTLTVNGGVAGNIEFTDNSTTTIRGTKGTVGTNDYWHIGGGATGSNAGYAEIATGDDGTEPIYVKQYTSGTATSTLTLLDASHNTLIPNNLSTNGDVFIENDKSLYISGTNLVLNNNDTAGATVDITSYRGAAGATSARIRWNETTDRWQTTVDNSAYLNIPNQNLDSTDSPAFAGVTGGNLSVGVATDNTIASTDTNGAITLDPNGTGNVVCTFSNGGNLTNDRNYVFGAIRNATTQSNGEVFTLGSAGTGFKGISLDNSADTTDGPVTILRSFTGGAVAGTGTRGRLIFERARGTSASPTAVQSADQIGSFEGTGYTSTGWLADTLAVMPAVFNYAATENWVSNTNLGTQATLLLAPSATTISTGANLVSVLAVNPQTFASRSDAFTWANGKTGTTQTMALDVSGNLTVTGDVRINGNNIQGSGGLAAIDLTSGNTLTTFRTNTALFQTAANVEYASINATGSEFTCSGITNFIRTGTSNGVFPSFLARYKRTDTTGSNNNDGAQVLLSTGGTSTTDNIARFDATYVTGGNHIFGIAVSSDSFSTVTNSTYKATREKTEILATPSGGGTSTVIMEVTDAKILNNRAHRNAITTGTVARGGEYTVPATANGSIELTITAGSGVTHIDVDAVASDATTGGMYSILIYNNSGNNNIDVQVRNNNVNIGLANNMDAGDRAIASVYVVGGYAACEIMDAA